jgi:hypothetical protein
MFSTMEIYSSMKKGFLFALCFSSFEPKENRYISHEWWFRVNTERNYFYQLLPCILFIFWYARHRFFFFSLELLILTN